ncbi:MAG: hypothetical protein KC620_13015, partial [Myxococcales bacterium]|nr:hypothetical protein [Myxococcales bacterium]
MQMFEGPGEEALDGEQRALLTRAREAFRELEKLTKNVGLYGKTHQSVERFRARLHAAVTELIGQRRSIEFQIGPYDFTLYDQSVYQNPTPERNFVYRFYLDGIRHLIFHAGVTQDELDRFVDVLLTDWDDPALFEDDSVTLLWQQDFAHIQYVLIDNFDEDAREDDAHVYTVAGVVEMVRSAPELAPPTAPPAPRPAPTRRPPRG